MAYFSSLQDDWRVEYFTRMLATGLEYQTNPEKTPSASVVIITRNRAEVLADCLVRLEKQTCQDFETIVVDSSDNHATRELVKSYPEVIYLRIWDGRNNMPEARNLGISNAHGEIVAFIDDDSMVFPNWLENIISGYSQNISIGGVGGCTIDPRLKIDINDHRFGKIFPDGTAIDNFRIDIPEPLYVEWFVGCNMSFRKSLLKDLGGFDQNYRGDNSYEEIDLAARVRKAGFSLLLVPSAKVEHIRVPRDQAVISRDWENPWLRFHQTHNRTYFVIKNIGLNKEFTKYIVHTLYGLAKLNLMKPDIQSWKQYLGIFWGFVTGFWDSYLARWDNYIVKWSMKKRVIS